MAEYLAGIDVGSTTVKIVITDLSGNIVYEDYSRHHAETRRQLSRLLTGARERLGNIEARVGITGSGSIQLAKALEVPFVQEVVAVATAVQREAPGTDVAIELGGEDAKIIYFAGGLDERMNGICAGGTGSFIDQMASLLQTDAAGLNEAASRSKVIYPIAARCGVFAKSDIQPLINEGATTPDLAASIFAAVVNQTVSGLACGKPIRGKVAFLGGPLHFLPELKKAFVRTLGLTPENTVDPPNSHLFAALGAALSSAEEKPVSLQSLLDKLDSGVYEETGSKYLEPLFESEEDYAAFRERHSRDRVKRAPIEDCSGDCFLGIDAGSTTTKAALVDGEGNLLYSFYKNNGGDPVATAKEAFAEMERLLPEKARIARSCATGYGEDLMKTAFGLDEGEVETVAHCTAATFFDPAADCVLDIGGQDMKCVKLRDGCVDNVLLNEACSSGCGSFLENFANSLGLSSEEFAKRAILARHPLDLGTRCTVFMNSNVKQAQKEGAPVEDISAGLAYSVIKNALFKVIRMTDAAELGSRIVAQGGTFRNEAVLRVLEKIAGREVVCPDISGIMGAFGAALLARDRYTGQPTTTLSFRDAAALTHETKTTRCGGCANNCMLTVNIFPGGKRRISGNRCEKPLGNSSAVKKGENLVEYKRRRIFNYRSLSPADAPRGVIGIPRVLNIYENYPFWATFFKTLGFSVVLSPFADRKIYSAGMESIPSESECYPAKLAHGAIRWLIDSGVKTVFHPSVFYEHKEYDAAQNRFNCPMVIGTPENIRNNVEDIAGGKVKILHPFLAMTSEKAAADELAKFCEKEWGIQPSETRAAVAAAWREQQKAKADIRAEGERALLQMEKEGGRGIVLAGRPYHIDPEINHGIPEMIAGYGLYVFTEDSVPADYASPRSLRVVDQWVYHSRLYGAAEFVGGRDDLELVQLNSFGCGLDAVTTDQTREILERSGKLYTVLKIDEVSNLGAARIRVRSLLAASKMRERKGLACAKQTPAYRRVEFTDEMRREGYTILAPELSRIHFEILGPVLRAYGINAVILEGGTHSAVETGLRYVNNDACMPSVTMVGQIMEAVLSGKYDTHRLAILMTQTGGCCRASNYIGFIRRALEKANLSYIPVISLNFNGMEKNSGFKVTPKALLAAVRAICCGDLLMRCLYRVRPYEAVPGSANELYKKWVARCVGDLTGQTRDYGYKGLCEGIVDDFAAFRIDDTLEKPRVGIVGEILVKYMEVANNHLVDLLESEGAEVTVPDFFGFLDYCMYNARFKADHLGTSKTVAALSGAALKFLQNVRRPAVSALKNCGKFGVPASIDELAELAEPFLSKGNQYGEGWMLTGEMAELIRSGVNNIICAQPFACLPNHIVGKGVMGRMKVAYPGAHIVAVDYDPSASEVNQLNRIKLLLAEAKRETRKASGN